MPSSQGAINGAIRLRVIIRVVAISVVLRNLVKPDLHIGTGNWWCRRMLLNKSFGLHDGGASGAKCVATSDRAVGLCTLSASLRTQCQTKDRDNRLRRAAGAARDCIGCLNSGKTWVPWKSRSIRYHVLLRLREERSLSRMWMALG